MGLKGPRGMLGSRSRAARQREQVREVEAGGSRRLSRWTGNLRPEEKGENRVQTSGVAHSGGGRGGGA